jgi:hypothetical protein
MRAPFESSDAGADPEYCRPPMRFSLVLLPPFMLLAGLVTGCCPAPQIPCSVYAANAAVATAPPAQAPAPIPAPEASTTRPEVALTSPPAAAPADPPAAFTQATEAARTAIGAGDYRGADRQLDAAAKVAGEDPHLRFRVAYFRATRFAYAGDFESAATAMVAVIPELAQHTDSADEFWAHNAMMMIREAQGDPAAALAENDQATLAAGRGTWEPDDRDTLAYLKDRWHRAYLTRMLAETRKGTARQALVRYAEAALGDYRVRARKLGSNEESIAVLEAYFAALDGNRPSALEAARKVDPAKDDDLEDLYLVVIGLDAGGDHAAAEALRRQMRQPGSVYLAHPIMLRWLDHDAKSPRDRTFTPWHPS